jgi:SSS family solute:Na+ symporter
MHWIDYLIFVVYMLAMLGVGLYFFNKIKLPKISMSAVATLYGLSVVATDVGGGFLLVLVVWFYHGVIRVLDAFTGLLGAWLSAVFFQK